MIICTGSRVWGVMSGDGKSVLQSEQCKKALSWIYGPELYLMVEIRF